VQQQVIRISHLIEAGDLSSLKESYKYNFNWFLLHHPETGLDAIHLAAATDKDEILWYILNLVKEKTDKTIEEIVTYMFSDMGQPAEHVVKKGEYNRALGFLWAKISGTNRHLFSDSALPNYHIEKRYELKSPKDHKQVIPENVRKLKIPETPDQYKEAQYSNILTLIDAINLGDTTTVEEFATHSIRWLTRPLNQHGFTALHLSALSRNSEMFSLVLDLLHKGTNRAKSTIINETKTKGGCTAVHFAGAFGFKGMLVEVTQAGVNLNCKDNDGWTPIHEATAFGNEVAIKQLISKGAKLTSVTNLGERPDNLTFGSKLNHGRYTNPIQKRLKKIQKAVKKDDRETVRKYTKQSMDWVRLPFDGQELCALSYAFKHGSYNVLSVMMGYPGIKKMIHLDSIRKEISEPEHALILIKAAPELIEPLTQDKRIKELLTKAINEDKTIWRELLTHFDSRDLSQYSASLTSLVDNKKVFSLWPTSIKAKHYFADLLSADAKVSETAFNLTKGHIAQHGLFHQAKDIEAAIEYYKLVSPDNPIEYIEALFELVNIYYNNNSGHKIALDQFETATKKYLKDHPNNEYIQELRIKIPRYQRAELAELFSKSPFDKDTTPVESARSVHTNAEVLVRPVTPFDPRSAFWKSVGDSTDYSKAPSDMATYISSLSSQSVKSR